MTLNGVKDILSKASLVRAEELSYRDRVHFVKAMFDYAEAIQPIITRYVDRVDMGENIAELICRLEESND